MTVIETKGDVVFLQDDIGYLFYRLPVGKRVYPLVNGRMEYLSVLSVRGMNICFNKNGVHGYSVWHQGTCIEDNVWELTTATQIAIEYTKSA